MEVSGRGRGRGRGRGSGRIHVVVEPVDVVPKPVVADVVSEREELI